MAGFFCAWASGFTYESGGYGGIRGKGDSQMNKKLFIVCGKSHYIVFLHLAVINRALA